MTTKIAKYKKPGHLIQPEPLPRGRQAVFDLVVAGSRAQPVRSMDDNDECCYRGPGGIRCFVGHLIPDKDYRPDMEGEPASDVLPLLGFDGDEIDLLDDLQQIHDSYTPEHWEEKFAETADAYGLTYTAPKEGS